LGSSCGAMCIGFWKDRFCWKRAMSSSCVDIMGGVSKLIAEGYKHVSWLSPSRICSLPCCECTRDVPMLLCKEPACLREFHDGNKVQNLKYLRCRKA
jgi:hypothetical protein